LKKNGISIPLTPQDHGGLFGRNGFLIIRRNKWLPLPWEILKKDIKSSEMPREFTLWDTESDFTKEDYYGRIH
jgi:hypothetical protein